MSGCTTTESNSVLNSAPVERWPTEHQVLRDGWDPERGEVGV